MSHVHFDARQLLFDVSHIYFDARHLLFDVSHVHFDTRHVFVNAGHVFFDIIFAEPSSCYAPDRVFHAEIGVF